VLAGQPPCIVEHLLALLNIASAFGLVKSPLLVLFLGQVALIGLTSQTKNQKRPLFYSEILNAL
jgi:hypothetical protein